LALSTLELARKFINIKSDPDNAPALREILALAVEQLDDFSIERFESNGYESILVYNTPTRPERFKLLLNGHLDVIPGDSTLYRSIIKGDRMYGVGSMDMKASVACMINSFRNTARMVDYPIGLQIVTDEEIGGFHGTKFQIDRGVIADFVIAGESTGFDIVNRAKGILWATVSCTGKTAHGAHPWVGDNALWKMHRFLTTLQERFPIPLEKSWKTTVNLSRIETTNRSYNKVPDDCTAALDIRFLPEDEEVIESEVRKILPPDFTLSVEAMESALHVDEGNSYLQALSRSAQHITQRPIQLYGAQGSSDARHFTRVGCAGVEFGPPGGGIGTDEEWVSISSLRYFEDILEHFLLKEVGLLD